MKRVLVVDDHLAVRVGFRSLIGSLGAPAHVEEAGTLDDALVLLMRSPHDLIIYDWHLPDGGGMRGLIAMRELSPQTPVIVISADPNDSVPYAALAAGARRFLPKATDEARTMEALSEFLVDGPPDPDDERAPQAASPPAIVLSQRQQDVLGMLARGLPDKRIAEALGIANATVRAHVSGLLRLLQASNRTEAVVKATRLRLIDTLGGAPPSPR